jgi:hypothetical protein
MIGRVEETSASSKPGPRLDSTRLRGVRGNSHPYRAAPGKAGAILPVQVRPKLRSSVRLVASVAGPLATVVAKRTQGLHGVWD